MNIQTKPLSSVVWNGDHRGELVLIDQTRLPAELVHVVCRDPESVWRAIKTLQVRGAPAIGIAAAYGIVLGAAAARPASAQELINVVEQVGRHLASSRPTAVNLSWAVNRMLDKAKRIVEEADRISTRFDSDRAVEELLVEARAIHEEDRSMCRAIGRHGAELLRHAQGVMTHCNAGGLATSEYGTALSILFTAQDQGHLVHVFVDETRPLRQGSRLTAWELLQRGIPTTLICDSMAAQVMREGRIQAVVTGADRIASNGDSANKIGTYALAVLAKAHRIPFYIAAPSSTFDLSIESGRQIPIEQRDAMEITHDNGRQVAPEGIDVYNPAFDVTPAELIEAIVTEKGVIQPVNAQTIAKVLGS